MVLEDEVKPKEKFWKIRQTTEQICTPLTAEDHVVQPIVDVSPPKWHLGHTTWFFETFILLPHKEEYKAFNDQYNYLFNSYYESVGARLIRTNRGNMTRPTVEEVLKYRAYVDGHMENFLESEVSDAISALLELGLQLEQQHQELLLYDIKYILGTNPLFPVYVNKKSPDGEHPVDEMLLEVEEGIYDIGYAGHGFSFDNEAGVHQVFVHDYGVMNHLVTNGEFLEFMEGGGYSNFRFWLSDGWEWVKNEQVKSPNYWYFIENKWHTYSLNGGLKEVNLHAPVTHISFYEADAFAKWKEMRLPTEFEWEIASRLFPGEENSKANFMESDNYEPVPRQEGQNQMFGDVWEWTNSAYLPYPYYKAPEGAVGEYNGKFMINQMVLRGGSCATPKNHIRPTYRNFFHPQLRWMFSGFRLAKHL